MSSNLLPDLVDNGIPFLGGVLATYLGFCDTSPRYQRYRTLFKVCGPALIVISIIRFVMAVNR